MKQTNEMILNDFLLAANWADDLAFDCDYLIKGAILLFKHYCKQSGLSLSCVPDIGHNLYLSAVGHGEGFWSRGLGQLGEELHIVAGMCGIQTITDVYSEVV